MTVLPHCQLSICQPTASVHIRKKQLVMKPHFRMIKSAKLEVKEYIL